MNYYKIPIKKQYHINLLLFFESGWNILVRDLNGDESKVTSMRDIYYKFPYNCYTDEDHINDNTRSLICAYYPIPGIND
jgi:hypothetical protein